MTFFPPFGRLLPAAAGRLADALYPPVCPSCRADTATPGALCPDCWRGLRFLSGPGCRYCGRLIPALAEPDPEVACTSCLAHPPHWRRGRAVFAYEGPGRRLVLALKHGDRLDMVPMLARWLLRTGGELLADAEIVCPVPLHWTRRLARRYNQSAELARALCVAAGAAERFNPTLLVRTRRTPSQHGRDRAMRAANLAGAIRPARGAADLLAGRRVLLVDDVLTTGATLDACTIACLEAGARSVDVLVLALVPFDEEAYLAAP